MNLSSMRLAPAPAIPVMTFDDIQREAGIGSQEQEFARRQRLRIIWAVTKGS